MRKHGLKVLTLALMAALGLMAFSASAQAENLKLGDEPETGTAGVFLTGNGAVKPSPAGAATQAVGGEQIGTGRLLVPGQKIEIVCGAAAVEEGFVDDEYTNWKTGVTKKGGHGHAKLLFLKCVVWETEIPVGTKEHKLVKELPACTATLESLAAEPTNHHITARVLILIKVHEGVTYLIAEPLIGGGTKEQNKEKAEKAEKLTLPFVTLHFEGTCALPETVNITGAVGTALPATDKKEPEVSLSTLGDTVQELLGLKLKFGANEAFIEGKAKVNLTGKLAVEWGAMP